MFPGALLISPWHPVGLTKSWRIGVPGRVNLIGEHIDYHNLAVLPMAIQQRIVMHVTESDAECVQAESAGFGVREFCLRDQLEIGAAGDWANYLKAAIKGTVTRWPLSRGFRAQITSDLPSAAGLSSSSALITGLTIALLRTNGIEASLDELMSILPDGEQFVGTRGGGMDHAAVLASRAGQASLLRFAPFSVEHVPIPDNWCFLVAHSLTRAEKSGAAKARYNACRMDGLNALSKLGLGSFQEALRKPLPAEDTRLSAEERAAYLHVVTEAQRVDQAVKAMRSHDRAGFGELLKASHASLRDRLQVSCPALDRIVQIANEAGADGARLTGAGFGGCAIILCTKATRRDIVAALEQKFYTAYSEYRQNEHMIFAEPSNGALYAGHD